MVGKQRATAKKRRRDADTRALTPVDALYGATDAVLVLGDGDFSFSQGLASHRGAGTGIVATSFDSETRVKSKYPNATACISAVRRAGGLVLHGVDATKLHLLPRSAHEGGEVPYFFQYIVFNFPHTGQQRVHLNRALLLSFFENARARLLPRGEAHVTLKTRPPYSNWLVEEQAKTAGLVLKERRKFDARQFPGYRHRTTDPQAKKFEAELCVTYTFVVNRAKYPFDPSAAPLADENNAERGRSVSESERSDNELLDMETVAPRSACLKRQKPPTSAASLGAMSASFRSKHAQILSSGNSSRSRSWTPWTPLHRQARSLVRRSSVRASRQRQEPTR